MYERICIDVKGNKHKLYDFECLFVIPRHPKYGMITSAGEIWAESFSQCEKNWKFGAKSTHLLAIRKKSFEINLESEFRRLIVTEPHFLNYSVIYIGDT